MIKNKRADIPITILVIGVLAICILTIFSFYSLNEKVRDDFDVLEAINILKLEKEKISFYENVGLSQEEIEKIIEIKKDNQGRKYLYIEQKKVSVRFNLPQ